MIGRRDQTEPSPFRTTVRGVYVEMGGRTQWLVDEQFYYEHSAQRPYVRAIRVVSIGQTSRTRSMSEDRFMRLFRKLP